MEQKTYYPILTPTKDDIEKVSEIFDDYNIPRNKYLICIFPGSRHFTKCYPIEKFANAILNIPDHFNCAILIMGDWTEKPLAIELKSYTGMKLYDLTGALSIAQTIAAVSLAHIVITNDSGPMHIAAALRKKQIAIYGATHTNLGFRPLNDDAIILESEVKCRPCSLHGGKSCKKGSLACLKNIHSDDVYDAFAYLFDEIITTETPIK
jgi:heptosyltransferase-2